MFCCCNCCCLTTLPLTKALCTEYCYEVLGRPHSQLHCKQDFLRSPVQHIWQRGKGSGGERMVNRGMRYSIDTEHREWLQKNLEN